MCRMWIAIPSTYHTVAILLGMYWNMSIEPGEPSIEVGNHMGIVGGVSVLFVMPFERLLFLLLWCTFCFDSLNLDHLDMRPS